MSFCQLSAVEGYCNRQVAALRYVTLYLPDDVQSMPEPYLQVHAADPVLVSGKSAYTIPFDKFSASLNTRPGAGLSGDFWTHSVQCNIRRNRKEVGLWMLQMKNRRFHILTQDWIGERMWFPFMRLQSSRTHEPQLTGTNGFTFTFTNSSPHPGIYLDPVLPPDQAIGAWGDPDANEYWDFGGDYIGNPG